MLAPAEEQKVATHMPSICKSQWVISSTARPKLIARIIVFIFHVYRRRRAAAPGARAHARPLRIARFPVLLSLSTSRRPLLSCTDEMLIAEPNAKYVLIC